MATLVAVGRRPTPVLDQEQGEPFGRARQVFLRVDATKHGVGGDGGVEALHQQPKRGLAARELVHAAAEHLRHACSVVVRSGSCERA